MGVDKRRQERETVESCGCNQRPGEGYKRADQEAEVCDLELKGQERFISDEGRQGTGEMREGRCRGTNDTQPNERTLNRQRDGW